MDTASWSLESMATFILVASLKGTLLVAMVLLVQKSCARWLSASGRYLLWLPVVFSLLTPPVFHVELPQRPLAAAAPESAAATGTEQPGSAAAASETQAAAATETPVLVAAAAVAALAPLPAAQAPANGLPSFAALLAALPYLWLAGFTAVLVMLVVAQHRLATLIRRATPAPQALQQVLADCLQQTACKAQVPLLHSGDVTVPMIAGLFRPVLLLPAAMAQQLTRAQLRHVFIHELMHLRRGDILVNWIVALAQALHWFNPAVWLAFHRLRQDRELACDSATLAHLAPGERASYGHTLLQLNDAAAARAVPAVALGILESASHLQRRIHMLVQHPRYLSLHSWFCGLLLLPLAAVAFSQPITASRSTSTPQALAEPGVVQTPVTQATTSTVLPDVATPYSVVVAASAADGTTTLVTTEGSTAGFLTQDKDSATASAAAQPQIAAEDTRIAPSPDLLLAQLDLAATAPVTENPAGAPPTPTSELATEPHAGLAAITQLAADIATMKADKIGFIEKWEHMGNTCDARKDRFFGVLAASCQRIRTAVRNGDILGFSYECYLLNAVHAQQLERYRETLAQQPEQPAVTAALQANEVELATFCSKDTFSAQYPAFAGILADAETQARTRPQQYLVSRFNPPWNGGQRWIDTVNSTSMISHVPPSSYSGPDTNSYSNGPVAVATPAGGEGMGGGTGGSPGADPGTTAPAPQ